MTKNSEEDSDSEFSELNSDDEVLQQATAEAQAALTSTNTSGPSISTGLPQTDFTFSAPSISSAPPTSSDTSVPIVAAANSTAPPSLMSTRGMSTRGVPISSASVTTNTATAPNQPSQNASTPSVPSSSYVPPTLAAPPTLAVAPALAVTPTLAVAAYSSTLPPPPTLPPLPTPAPSIPNTQPLATPTNPVLPSSWGHMAFDPAIYPQFDFTGLDRAQEAALRHPPPPHKAQAVTDYTNMLAKRRKVPTALNREVGEISAKRARSAVKSSNERNRRKKNTEMGVDYTPKGIGKKRDSWGFSRQSRRSPVNALASRMGKFMKLEKDEKPKPRHGKLMDWEPEDELQALIRAGEIAQTVNGPVWVGGVVEREKFGRRDGNDDDDDDDLVL